MSTCYQKVVVLVSLSNAPRDSATEYKQVFGSSERMFAWPCPKSIQRSDRHIRSKPTYFYIFVVDTKVSNIFLESYFTPIGMWLF